MPEDVPTIEKIPTSTGVRYNLLISQLDKFFLPSDCEAKYDILNCKREEIISLADDLGLKYSQRFDSKHIYLFVHHSQDTEIRLWEETI